MIDNANGNVVAQVSGLHFGCKATGYRLTAWAWRWRSQVMQVDGVGLRFFRALSGPSLGRSAGFGFKGKLHVMNDAGAFSSVRFLFMKSVPRTCASVCLRVCLPRCGLVVVSLWYIQGLVVVSLWSPSSSFLFGFFLVCSEWRTAMQVG